VLGITGIFVLSLGLYPLVGKAYFPRTAFVQVGLQDDHTLSSFQYMDRVRAKLRKRLPELTTYFQTGGLVDAIVNLGLPAPFDVQVSGSNLEAAHEVATRIAEQAHALHGVSDVYVPQDINYPSLKLDIDRVRASELGLNELHPQHDRSDLGAAAGLPFERPDAARQRQHPAPHRVTD
jgi:HAE1 family hydrophobic/amphiphilic exporter-1